MIKRNNSGKTIMIKLINTKKGFTLIELMVVLVIAGIIVAMAIPNVAGYISNQEINAAAELLATDMR